MSKKAELKKHIDSLHEVRDIVAAMKNLAFAEIHKLQKFIVTQKEMLVALQKTVADFMAFYMDSHHDFLNSKIAGYVIIGSERGFCGNFNAEVRDFLVKEMSKKDVATLPVIVVGRRLAEQCSDSGLKFSGVSGVNAVEEINLVIINLLNAIKTAQQKITQNVHLGSWAIIYNQESDEGILPKLLRPFADLLNISKAEFSLPPLINLSCNDLNVDLLENYFLAILFHVFYTSFMAENRSRFLHMQNAAQWIDKKNAKLKINYNRLRQEEITEELEVILLSAKAVVEEEV